MTIGLKLITSSIIEAGAASVGEGIGMVFGTGAKSSLMQFAGLLGAGLVPVRTWGHDCSFNESGVYFGAFWFQ